MHVVGVLLTDVTHPLPHSVVLLVFAVVIVILKALTMVLLEIHVSHISRRLILHIRLSSISLWIITIALNRILALPILIRITSSLVVLHTHRIELLVWHTLHVLVHSVVRLLRIELHLAWHASHVAHCPLNLLRLKTTAYTILPICWLLL